MINPSGVRFFPFQLDLYCIQLAGVLYILNRKGPQMLHLLALLALALHALRVKAFGSAPLLPKHVYVEVGQLEFKRVL